MVPLISLYSSLGSNLQPSVDTWENLFAALVSVLGLLLFLYLIGNLQVGTESFMFLLFKCSSYLKASLFVMQINHANVFND